MSTLHTAYSLTYWYNGGGVVFLAGFHYLAPRHDQISRFLSTVSGGSGYMDRCLPKAEWVCSEGKLGGKSVKPMKS